MRSWSLAVGIVALSAGLGCAQSKSETPSTAPRPAQREGARPEGGREGRPPEVAPRPAGQPGAPRRVPQPPNWEKQDSVRKASIAEILKSVEGRENEPAGQVFKNVKYNRDMPVKQFLTMMDEQYGRGLGNACTGCHANTNVGGVVTVDYASDKPKNKQIARLMEKMQQSINKDLAKNHGLDEDYPKATCVMCHRGTAHMPNTMKQPKNSDPPPPTRQRG
jgi:hypothetical protein